MLTCLSADSPLYRGLPHPLPAASHLVHQVVPGPTNYVHDNPHKYKVSFQLRCWTWDPSLQAAPLPPPDYPDEPRLYKYAYSVDDDYEGAVLKVAEESDEYGTQGSYEVNIWWGELSS